MKSLQNQRQNQDHHTLMANALRFLAIDAIEKAKSGHPGMPMGMADVATVLFSEFLVFDPDHPTWPNRDRFILSAGHGSMLSYALLHLTGYPLMTLEELKRFRQLGSLTPGHPEYGLAPGIETTTGPLGQGLGAAVGMALSEKILSSRSSVIDHYTYVIASDGDLMEGISHEVASFAGHHQLSKLIVLWDDNHISIDGPTDLTVSDNSLKRFEAYHWHTQAIDGHNPTAIKEALLKAQKDKRPSLIACRTTIAYGAPTKAGTAASHGSPLGEEESQATRANLDWPYPPFEIPQEIYKLWQKRAEYGKKIYKKWSETISAEQLSHLKATLPDDWDKELKILIKKWHLNPPALATRQLSQTVLENLTKKIPCLIGGSADLTPSNNTKTNDQKMLTPQDCSGSYIHYGVREHGMAAIMNGLALYGSFIPYGGTFLAFSDYLRPALRLSALMSQRVIYVFTHDSIGLGEDGPTHQPVEQLASLRSIPNLNVFRPADGIEVAECWMLALESLTTPSVLALTRQPIQPFRRDVKDNLSSYGAYVVVEPSQTRQVTLLATGSEVGIALETSYLLKEKGIAAAVVSMPCWRLFDQQSLIYQESVLGTTGLRVGVEAALSFGWDRYLKEKDFFVGVESFGLSAPSQTLYQHFNITKEHLVTSILEKLGV
ncbi:MAG: transketolase [Proteobacteria bacterium]|nr:transketolase [Pseudomonadota bacterium]